MAASGARSAPPTDPAEAVGSLRSGDGRYLCLARPTHLKAGEVAYSVDDQPQLIVLHTGCLKIVRLSTDGSEQLFRVLGPGEFTGETSVFTGQRSDGYATALDECQLNVGLHERNRSWRVAALLKASVRRPLGYLGPG